MYKSMERHVLSNQDKVTKKQWEKQMVEEDLKEKLNI